MGVYLSDIIKMQCFKNSKLVAGTIEDKKTIVEGITIIEAPDIANWIKGGELLLTSFYSIDKDIETQKNLVRKLGEKGAAALIIKTSRFLKEIPSEIIHLGNEIDFPIIEISGETKYIDIMYPVMGEIFNDQVNRLNYYKECHEKFTKLSLKMKGISSVVKTLQELVENPIVIFDNEFNIISSSDDLCDNMEIVNDEMYDVLGKGYPVYGLEVKLKDEESMYSMIVEPIQVLNNIKAYLGVIEKNKLMEDMDFIPLENASTTLRLEMLKEVAITEVELKYKGDLIDDLVNGRFDSEQSIYDRGNLFGWDLKRKFIVTLINISEYNNYLKSNKNVSEGLHLLRDKIKKIIDRVAYHYVTDYISVNKGDDIILLWPVKRESDIKNIYKHIKDMGSEIKQTINSKLENQVTLSLGIGGLANNPTEIKKSFAQARDAVTFGQRILGTGSITVFDELGIYKLLCSYENREDLENFVHPELLKLREYDRDKNNELIETLEKYLACNLNATKTAEELYVHYKTVLYRLNRIKEIINLDIDNRANMLEIEIGLKILNILR